MIPYGRQRITQADIDAVAEVLRSDFLTQGPAVPRFERAVASEVHARHAIAVNSATSALHVACMALGLEPGDRFWTTPNTFVASANCGRYCGADVEFVDIDPLTWNMSVPALKEKLVQARRATRLPKVVIPVHFTGQPPEQRAIWELAQEYGFRVLEDASHAIGASSEGEPVGSCRWSDVTVFSFHPVKIVTTGEGGMALTNDDELAERMSMLRSHGITRDPARFLQRAESTPGTGEGAFDPWHYEQQMLGFNYRMTDIQAALGTSQLARLHENVERRNVLARSYDQALRSLSLQLPSTRNGDVSAFHLYVVRLTHPHGGKTHRQCVEQLRARGIGVNVHYMPVHLQPYYRALGFHEGQYPQAELHGRSAISLPLFPSLSDTEQNQVVQALHEVFGHR